MEHDFESLENAVNDNTRNITNLISIVGEPDCYPVTAINGNIANDLTMIKTDIIDNSTVIYKLQEDVIKLQEDIAKLNSLHMGKNIDSMVDI